MFERFSLEIAVMTWNMRIEDHGYAVKILLPIFAHDQPREPGRCPPVDIAQAVPFPKLPIADKLVGIAQGGSQRHASWLIPASGRHIEPGQPAEARIDYQVSFLMKSAVSSQQSVGEVGLNTISPKGVDPSLFADKPEA